MGLNKSKKLAKKSVKPEPVVEEIVESEELDEIEEAPAPKRYSGDKSVQMVEGEDDLDVPFDTDSVINDIVSNKRNLTSAIYQVQLRLPAELEPLYKGLTPRLKKALRDAFGELVRKAYAQTH